MHSCWLLPTEKQRIKLFVPIIYQGPDYLYGNSEVPSTRDQEL